ncbi:MAG: patatin-like phospholipase family protein [Burkholderiales bacterium]|nr:patatin-like phospholipase family protein [Burkholderiales bacterium]
MGSIWRGGWGGRGVTRSRCWWGLGLALALTACQTVPPVVPVAPPPVVAPEPPPAPKPVPRLPRIGLALGGGAARGFAHIGVIEVLEEAGIRPDLVVGTSAGSLIAALLADGKTGPEMAGLARTMDEGTLTDWAFPTRGAIRGQALARYVRAQVSVRNIEQTRLPLGIVATDLDSGEAVLFRRGDIGTAVRASSAVPAVFEPVRIGSREYVDGGLVAPVPVHFAREMGAEFVIAVDISSPPAGNPTGDVMDMLLQTFAIMGQTLNGWELRSADVVVRPAMAGLSSADFTARQRAIRAGREAALRVLPALKARLAAAMR